jgi:hypothetical protein
MKQNGFHSLNRKDPVAINLKLSKNSYGTAISRKKETGFTKRTVDAGKLNAFSAAVFCGGIQIRGGKQRN